VPRRVTFIILWWFVDEEGISGGNLKKAEW
jgi:hypothetical protein